MMAVGMPGGQTLRNWLHQPIDNCKPGATVRSCAAARVLPIVLNKVTMSCCARVTLTEKVPTPFRIATLLVFVVTDKNVVGVAELETTDKTVAAFVLVATFSYRSSAST